MKFQFTKASDVLAERLSTGNQIKRRFGVIIDVVLEKANDLTDRFEQAFQGATDRLENALVRAIDNCPESHKAAFRLQAASALKLSPDECMSLITDNANSPSVIESAAKLPKIAPEIQTHLLQNYIDMKPAMLALASNMDSSTSSLAKLSDHPAKEVRENVAREVGARMRLINHPEAESIKILYNSMVNDFEPAFAKHLVPVCRDVEQLEHMFKKTTPLNSSAAEVFVNNPHSSKEILLDVASNRDIGFLLDGARIANEAKNQLKNRFSLDDDPAPSM